MNMLPNVYICALRKNSEPQDNKMYLPGTIVNSQMMLIKINKKGAIAKVRILVEQVIL